MTQMTLNKKDPPESAWLQVYTRIGHYPKCWSKGIPQRKIIEWAEGQCEHCGATKSTALLHVHHLTWDNKHDCRWENLVCLCTSHHTALHNQRWQPGQPWIERWGDVPQWAIIRGHLEQCLN